MSVLDSNTGWAPRARIARQTRALDLQILSVKDERFEVRSQLASNPTLKPEVQLLLVGDWHPAVILSLASNPCLSSEAQKIIFTRIMAGNPLDSIMTQLALSTNPALSAEIQLVVCDEKSPWMTRSSLAKNPSLLPKVQARLARSKEPWVADGLAQNPSLKLVPAILLYLGDNEEAKGILKTTHPKIWRKIKRLEQVVLKNKGVGFAKFGDNEQLHEIAKKILIEKYGIDRKL